MNKLWHREDLDQCFTYTFSDEFWSSIHSQSNHSPAEVSLFASEIARLQTELEFGSGVCLVKGFPCIDDMDQLADTYILFCQAIGNVCYQNNVGHLISHVRDQKVKREDIANGIVNDTTQFQTKNRPYLSNEYLEFHTDLCDVTGLLCVHPSPKGGENKVVSSIAVFEELNTHFPRMAKALSTPLQLMHQTPDMPDGKNHPILHAPFSECQGYFSSFMLGSYIRTTYERRGLDLDPMVLDAITSNDKYRACFIRCCFKAIHTKLAAKTNNAHQGNIGMLTPCKCEFGSVPA